MSEIEVKFPQEDQPSRIVKWKVSVGSIVTAGKIILIYTDVATGKPEKKMKATNFGKVVQILVKANEVVHPGQSILVMEPCKHLAVMKDLCASCGADLREENADKSSLSQAVVPMVHSIPELKVAPELAEKIGREDIERLLRDKKLVLLVDLDQTIVHTTNDNVPADQEDVFHFQLGDPKMNSHWYHTRLRPHTRRFLTEISQYYELHICSFGVRQYAHHVASLLDPDGKLFSHRILSRDECFDPMSKTANLKALFPLGVDMVCIIDDRDDVWQGCNNLVQVKPYVFFMNTSDINLPVGLEQHNDSKSSKSLPEISGNHTENIENKCDDVKEIKNDLMETNELEDKKVKKTNETQEKEDTIEKTDEKSVEKISEPADKETEKISEEEVGAGKSRKRHKEKLKKEELGVSIDDHCEDHDDYLLYLEDILKRIHTEFYTETSESLRIKSLSKIIPKVRSRVLEGVHLTFSGIIPNNTELQQSRAFKVARAFGAKVTKDLSDETTHLVAIQLGTAKVRDAKKNRVKVKIVHPDWLWTCAERWERVDERLYPVTAKQISSPKNRDSRKPPPHCGTPEYVTDYMPTTETFAQSVTPLMAMTSDEIVNMEKEVDEDLSDFGESSDNNSNHIGNDDSDSDEVYGQDELEDDEPCPKKRKSNSDNESDSDKNNEDDDDDNDDDESPATRFRRGEGLPEDFDDNTNDSVGHLINEDLEDDREYVAMGSAIEREFLSDQ